MAYNKYNRNIRNWQVTIISEDLLYPMQIRSGASE